MALLITIFIVLALLVVSEIFWRNHEIHPEIARKFVHISVGTFVAFWPLFLSWREIIGLSAAFIVGIGISRYFNIFKAIHSVQRPTWGEVLFGASVGLVAYVTHDGWIYCAALLHMSLADGLAAVVGTRFGRRHRYQLFGGTKSRAGTLTFFAVSLLILSGYHLLTPGPFSGWFVLTAIVATLLENVAVRGLDNLLIPVFVALVLGSVH